LSRLGPAILGLMWILVSLAALMSSCQTAGPGPEIAAPTNPSGSATGAAPTRANPDAISTVSALATAFVSRATATPQSAIPTEAAPRGPATLTPTSIPVAASTQAVPPTPAGFRTLLDERFLDNQHGWPNDPKSTAWLTGGAYQLFARQPSQFVAIGAPLDEVLGDVVVTGAFRKVGGPPGGGYGLIVRDQRSGPRDGITQDGQFVVLEAGDLGEFGVWRRDGTRWIDVIPWTPSEVVHRGAQPNQVVVQILGTDMTFFVNGIEIAGVRATTLSRGGVGIFVGGDSNQVVLDRFTVQVPE
jgi:hypothetical protein